MAQRRRCSHSGESRAEPIRMRFSAPTGVERWATGEPESGQTLEFTFEKPVAGGPSRHGRHQSKLTRGLWHGIVATKLDICPCAPVPSRGGEFLALFRGESARRKDENSVCKIHTIPP